ncbi:MAG: hypothetical protein ACRDBF_01840 [Plesiomonas shigelloides]
MYRKGSISVADGIKFDKQCDAVSLFGRRYKMMMQGGCAHHASRNDPEPMGVWFPKLFDNRLWSNRLAERGNIIYETSKKGDHLDHLEWQKTSFTRQVVFGAFRLSDRSPVYYKFLGVYRFDASRSVDGVACWVRESVETKCYPIE